jgi:hypothetical protein
VYLHKDREAKQMAKRNTQSQLELLEGREREAILYTLYARGGAFAKAIDEEVERRLSLVTWEDVARDVVDALRVVDDDAAYDSAERGPWGYRGYEETASALIRDQFEPLLDTIEDAAREGRADLALIAAEGILLGLYRFERTAHFNYIDAIPDDWFMMGEETVKTWETLYPDDEDSLLQLAAFITANCPDWEYLAPGQESMQSLRR